MTLGDFFCRKIKVSEHHSSLVISFCEAPIEEGEFVLQRVRQSEIGNPWGYDLETLKEEQRRDRKLRFL